MTEKEKKILETMCLVIPKMNDLQREKLLSFGEGMAYMVSKEEHKGKELQKA